MSRLYDITEVCTMLDVTSRTLRYYESEHLIESIVIPPSQRRKYNEEQLEEIKGILALRALGLPIKSIKELIKNKTSFKEAIQLHRAELLCILGEKQRQINLLEEILHDIDSSPADSPEIKKEVVCTERQLEIAESATDAIIQGDYNKITEYYSEEMKKLLPKSAVEYAIKEHTAPLGSFISREAPIRDAQYPNIVLCSIKYERMIYRLKYVFTKIRSAASGQTMLNRP